MAGEVEQFASCADCGATIYPEHLEKRVAEHWEGKLLCPFCLREKRVGSAVGMTPPALRAAVARAATLVALEAARRGASMAYEKPTAVRAWAAVRRSARGRKVASTGGAAEGLGQCDAVQDVPLQAGGWSDRLHVRADQRVGR
jgi:hypothetical protein